MTGLMLGALLKEKPNRPARLLDVQALDAGVRLCFSRLPKAAVLEEAGAFVMLFAVEPADAQQGVLSLPSGGLASWHLSERSDGMQLGFVSLQPLRGSWSKDPDNSSCIRVDIFMAP